MFLSLSSPLRRILVKHVKLSNSLLALIIQQLLLQNYFTNPSITLTSLSASVSVSVSLVSFVGEANLFLLLHHIHLHRKCVPIQIFSHKSQQWHEAVTVLAGTTG